MARTRYHHRSNTLDPSGWGGDANVRHLRSIASNRFLTPRGSIYATERTERYDGFASGYAGSIAVYNSDAGTYITGYSDGGFAGPVAPVLRPRAKIIDVARMRSACSFENGVCVIRP